MPPVIGITTYAVDEGGRITLPHEYVDAVRRAGGIPVLLPPGQDDPTAVLDAVGGLILAGGGDIDPARYAGDRHPTVYGTDPSRDEFELALAHEVLERRLPTFAICRGMQVLNVALGGTLVQHVPDVVGDEVLHRAPPREPVPHRVELEDRSTLADVLGARSIETMSWHHQSVDQPGDGLRVVARAPDGIVEAVEVDGQPELLVVQWHPELTAATDPTQQALFDHLVEHAAKRRAPA